MNIKCGRRIYEIKTGDKLFTNGCAYMFIPKDNSILPMSDHWHKDKSAKLSKTEWKRIVESGLFDMDNPMMLESYGSTCKWYKQKDII